MAAHCALVHYPTFPYSLRALTPHARLATMAGGLANAGHDPVIWDAGTVEMLARRASGIACGQLRQTTDSLIGHIADGLSIRNAVRNLRAHEQKVVAGWARALTANRPPDLLVFTVDAPEEWGGICELATLIKQSWPGTPQFITGAIPTQYSTLLNFRNRSFAGIIREGDEEALCALADTVGQPSLWRGIQGLILADSEASDAKPYSPGPVSMPVYDAGVYPAMAGDAKLRVFSIHERVPQSQSPWRDSSASIRRDTDIAREVRTVQSRYEGAAFVFEDRNVPTGAIARLSHRLLRDGLDVLHARAAHVCDITPDTMPLLRAAGCCSLGLHVFTGSQLLLDRVYGAPIGVTEIEHRIHAAKTHGFYTVAQFHFPCVEDDYHTEAETLRLVQRTRPHGALVHPPMHAGLFRPAAQWRADAFGRRVAGAPGSMPGLDFSPNRLSTIYRGTECLEHGFAEIETPTRVSAELALVAAVLGWEGDEAEFAERMQEQLAHGDPIRVSSLVESFNYRLAARARAEEAGGFTRFQAVVGN